MSVDWDKSPAMTGLFPVNVHAPISLQLLQCLHLFCLHNQKVHEGIAAPVAAPIHPITLLNKSRAVWTQVIGCFCK